MAIKLNSNALVNQSIEEEKLASGVQTKLNKESIPDAPDNKDYVRTQGQWKEFAGVEEAPIDDSAYIRKNAGWEKYDYPPIEEPIIIEVTTIGMHDITVPLNCHYCEAFLVNGGNGGLKTATPYYSYGGGGGYTSQYLFQVSPLEILKINIGNGGNGFEGEGYANLGELTYIDYKDTIYAPQAQNKEDYTPESQKGQDGVLNPLNPSDTKLYGAYGGNDMHSGGNTGGGDFNINTSGSFYGAGGYVGYGLASKGTYSGYRGYAYLKFT